MDRREFPAVHEGLQTPASSGAQMSLHLLGWANIHEIEERGGQIDRLNHGRELPPRQARPLLNAHQQGHPKVVLPGAVWSLGVSSELKTTSSDQRHDSRASSALQCLGDPGEITAKIRDPLTVRPRDLFESVVVVCWGRRAPGGS